MFVYFDLRRVEKENMQLNIHAQFRGIGMKQTGRVTHLNASHVQILNI